MKALRLLVPALFVLVSSAAQANGITIANTFEAKASNFVPSFKACPTPVPGPIDPVTVAFSISFENSANITDSTANITLISLNLPNGGPLIYSYNQTVDELDVGNISPAGTVTPGVNNFALHIKNISTNPTVNSLSYSLGSPHQPCLWLSGDVALTIGPPWTHVPFPLTGVRLGQTIRLNMVAGPVPVPGPGPCEALLNIYDAANNLVASQSASTPGSVAFDYSFRSALTASGRSVGRKELRPEAILMPGASAAGACQGRATAEVYDDLTKSTSLIVPELNPGIISEGNPGPIQFGPIGVGFLQTVRLNVVAYPPSPCEGMLSFTDTQGNPIGAQTSVSLTGGNASFIDLPGTAIPSDSGHGEVMAVFTPGSVPGAAPGACIPSVEVFDPLTGGTQVLVNPGPIN